MTKPTLVLLPGMDGTGLLFQPFLDAIGDVSEINVQTIAYPAREALGYAELTELAFNELPRAGPLLILGESFSGADRGSAGRALRRPCARRHPVQLLRAQPRPRWAWLTPLLQRAPMPAPPSALVARALFGRHATPRLRALLAKALTDVAPDVLRARLIAVSSVDASTALAAQPAPLLYLLAREDRLVPASAWAWVKQHRPDARVVPFDAPHALLQACPEEAAEAITAFVREVSA